MRGSKIGRFGGHDTFQRCTRRACAILSKVLLCRNDGRYCSVHCSSFAERRECGQPPFPVTTRPRLQHAIGASIFAWQLRFISLFISLCRNGTLMIAAVKTVRIYSAFHKLPTAFSAELHRVARLNTVIEQSQILEQELVCCRSASRSIKCSPQELLTLWVNQSQVAIGERFLYRMGKWPELSVLSWFARA